MPVDPAMVAIAMKCIDKFVETKIADKVIHKTVPMPSNTSHKQDEAERKKRRPRRRSPAPRRPNPRRHNSSYGPPPRRPAARRAPSSYDQPPTRELPRREEKRSSFSQDVPGLVHSTSRENSKTEKYQPQPDDSDRRRVLRGSSIVSDYE